MVPNVTIDNNSININGNNVTLTLSWGEPFNNLDPIVNYTVSCSGDVTCPPNFITTDNTIRSYTITNLTTMTTYTFSVVATNSIGSGEVGVVMFTGTQEKEFFVIGGCFIREYVLKFYIIILCKWNYWQVEYLAVCSNKAIDRILNWWISVLYG